jgi:hypothetical protein
MGVVGFCSKKAALAYTDGGCGWLEKEEMRSLESNEKYSVFPMM